MQQTKESVNPFLQILLFIGLSLLGISIFYLLGILLAQPIFWVSRAEIQHLLSGYKDINLLKYFQFISQLGLFVVPPLLFYFILERKIVKPLQLNTSATYKTYFFVFLLTFTILPVINILAVWNQSIQFPESLKPIYDWLVAQEEKSQMITQKLLEGTSIPNLLSNLFIIALMPAIGEELFFRGVLQKIFVKWFKNAHVAIFFTGFLFSAFHFQFFGFFPRMLLGIMFGYYFYWSKSLWLSIFGHFVNNASAVVVAYYANVNHLSMTYEDFGSYNDNATLILLNLALSGFLMFFIYREEVLRKKR